MSVNREQMIGTALILNTREKTIGCSRCGAVQKHKERMTLDEANRMIKKWLSIHNICKPKYITVENISDLKECEADCGRIFVKATNTFWEYHRTNLWWDTKDEP